MVHSHENLMSAQLARGEMRPSLTALPVGDGTGTRANLKEKAQEKSPKVETEIDSASGATMLLVLAE